MSRGRSTRPATVGRDTRGGLERARERTRQDGGLGIIRKSVSFRGGSWADVFPRVTRCHHPVQCVAMPNAPRPRTHQFPLVAPVFIFDIFNQRQHLVLESLAFFRGHRHADAHPRSSDRQYVRALEHFDQFESLVSQSNSVKERERERVSARVA